MTKKFKLSRNILLKQKYICTFMKPKNGNDALKAIQVKYV